MLPSKDSAILPQLQQKLTGKSFDVQEASYGINEKCVDDFMVGVGFAGEAFFALVEGIVC